LTLDIAAAGLLAFAAEGAEFSLAAAAAALPLADVDLLEQSVRQFVNVGILEPAR
jgi:hypothetical protein